MLFSTFEVIQFGTEFFQKKLFYTAQTESFEIHMIGEILASW